MTYRQNYFFILLVASSLFIFIVTISPFDFTAPQPLSWENIIQEFHYATNLKDYVRNILLFIPLGIALLGIINFSQKKAWQIVLFGILVGASISSTIELTQAFLPDRISSLSDIICNSLGAGLGTAIYIYRRQILAIIQAIISHKYSQVNIKFLAVVILSYCLSLATINWLFLNDLNFDNWHDSYHLAIGSDVEGSAAWNGYLQSLYLSDRSLNQAEIAQAFLQTQSFFENSPNLVTGFIFSQPQKKYYNLKQQVPDLVWQLETNISEKNLSLQESAKNQNKQVLFKYQNSLITQDSPVTIARSIKKNNEFTISLTAATNRFKQVGPARIVSYAGELSKRNFMLGQESKNLIIFLRSQITGESGSEPTFMIPNLFSDYNFHHIIITFSQQELTVYIDKLANRYSFQFNLATTPGAYLPWQIKNWRIDLTQFNLRESNLTFYGIALFPLAILISILLTKLKD